MIRTVLIGLVLAASVGIVARAQISNSGPTQVPAILPGVYTLADGDQKLPPAADNQTRFAYVADMGGGPGYVTSDGTNWRRAGNRGRLVAIPATSQTIDTLRVGSILSLPSGELTSAITLTLAVANCPPGTEVTVINPGTLGLTGKVGIGLEGTALSSFVPVLGQKWADLMCTVGGVQIIRTAGLF